MSVLTKLTVAAVIAFGALASAESALACKTGCSPPAPPTRPTNPSGPNMPHYGGGNFNNNVVVNNTVSVNNSVSASGGYGVRYGNISGGYGTTYGGGYSNWSQTPGYPQNIGLNVSTEEAIETYSEAMTSTRTMIIQASCIDDKGIPHPASQVGPMKNIDGVYSGEVYRCIAGTHMQVTMADYNGSDVNFSGGRTLDCAKNEALWHEKGTLTCRTQISERQCNERSLLRRFGAGYKIVTITSTEMVSRSRKVESKCTAGCGMSTMVFDGGVGGYVQ